MILAQRWQLLVVSMFRVIVTQKIVPQLFMWWCAVLVLCGDGYPAACTTSISTETLVINARSEVGGW